MLEFCHPFEMSLTSGPAANNLSRRRWETGLPFIGSLEGLCRRVHGGRSLDIIHMNCLVEQR